MNTKFKIHIMQKRERQPNNGSRMPINRGKQNYYIQISILISGSVNVFHDVI